MSIQAISGAIQSRFAGALFPIGRQKIVLTFVCHAIALRIVVAIVNTLLFGYSFGPDIISPLVFLRYLAYVLALWCIAFVMRKRFPNFYDQVFVPTFNKDLDESHIIQEAFDKEVQYNDRETLLSNKLRALQAVDARIERLRIRTTIMLYAIGALLLGATLIVIFAGNLTNLDASVVSNVERLGSEINSTESRLSSILEAKGLVSSLNSQNLSAEQRDQLQKRLSQAASYNSLPPDAEALTALTNETNEKLAGLRQLLQKAWEKELSSEHGYNDTRYIIATAITRVGVVLIIVFLVQILFGLYRYNTRLVTFYHSRRDLLQLWDGKSNNVERLHKMLAPNIEFGKEPKHPLEDIIRQVLEKVKPSPNPLEGGAEKK